MSLQSTVRDLPPTLSAAPSQDNWLEHLRQDVDTDAGGGLYPGLWPEAERRMVEPLLPAYRGDAAPQPWNREPTGLTRGPT